MKINISNEDLRALKTLLRDHAQPGQLAEVRGRIDAALAEARPGLTQEEIQSLIAAAEFFTDTVKKDGNPPQPLAKAAANLKVAVAKLLRMPARPTPQVTP